MATAVTEPKTLRLALRVVAIVLAFEMAVTGHYGLAPGPLYLLLIAGDPPVVAGVAAAFFTSKGKARPFLGLALAGFTIVALVALSDFGASRLRIGALRGIATRSMWEISGFANIAGMYGLTFAARALARSDLESKIATLSLGLLGLTSVLYVITRWLSPVPGLVPFFSACLFAITAACLFVVTSSPPTEATRDRVVDS